MRKLYDNTGFFGRTGGFWHEGTTQDTKQLARHMSHAAAVTGVNYSLDAAARGLTTGGAVYASNFEIPWDPLHVAAIGADMQARFVTKWAPAYTDGSVAYFVIRRPTDYSLAGDGDVIITFPSANSSESFTFQTEECEYILFPVAGGTPDAIDPTELEIKWVIPVPNDVRPAVIAVGDRYLIAGVDFMLQRGALIFRENPYYIFKDQDFIHCLAGWRPQTYLMDYTLETDYDAAAQKAVAYFYRSSQAAPAMLAALMDIAGRIITDRDVMIIGKQSWCDAIVYLTDAGDRWEINYRHDEYAVGDFIPAGTLFGGGIRVEGGRPAAGMWHREFDWSSGIDLSTISPFRNLLLQDAPMRFEAYEDNGFKLHVRPHVIGDSVDKTPYWDWIKEAELRTGYYLNDILALATVGDDVNHNGIDFYFEYILGAKGLVVELDRALLGSRAYERCKRFAETEKLHDTVLLLRTI